MSINNQTLLSHLNQLLKPEKVKDYCPNGLQVEGVSEISKIVTGVTACQALIDRAVELNADAIFVHHGYFWRGENPCIVGMKRQRIKQLINHDINLYGYHLPLDIHPELGNNAQLAKRLNIEVIGGLEQQNPQSVAMHGQFETPLTLQQLAKTVEQSLQRTPQIISAGEHSIKSIGWCTGGGQSYIEMAAEQGIDAFISGEISEQTVHVAREMGIHFIAAGHHATERYGAKALGEYLAKSFDLDVTFVDIDNPV
ncbi:Nif3-like dinuclear metal center hexameric protein [Aliiglaciecola sp. 2_MG-2023]|uniref:Nif3-like dinuclear metal center hexameric protein n=1 Tax=Alteromonadaceae TaxID=72275 RepID=UPI0026E204C0|nr:MULTISPECIES: Nif3-like dinuclear metal center hexameric protein [unclassified Aliiglaciecola]MDO6712239.1 Nif3-like dinuclear metal center hexameric protein [Aliiglaciecola sp. 2_MG-2023]MDO6753523.1 Nif3-like dinuclear metal center hexameric protein [Aliiglaciecola sp. 1_MG-2023]